MDTLARLAKAEDAIIKALSILKEYSHDNPADDDAGDARLSLYRAQYFLMKVRKRHVRQTTTTTPAE